MLIRSVSCLWHKQLPIEFAAKDRLGRMSIVEMGFLSLTGARHVAMQYAAGGDLSMVLKVERGDRSSGAFIGGLSFYCEEEEVVFPPLCNLERVGQPTMYFDDNGTAVTEVPVSITVNQVKDMSVGTPQPFLSAHLSARCCIRRPDGRLIS